MKNKFLLLLPICLILSLNLTSCDDSINEKSVTGLWEQLRNTAWTMENDAVTFTIGFYGPQNGPSTSSEPYIDLKGDYPYNDPIYKEIYDDWKNPYAEIRITSKATGRYYFTKLSRLEISRTGKISESRSDAYNKYMTEQAKQYGWVYTKEFMRSFNVSISEGGFLSISGAKMTQGGSSDSAPKNSDGSDNDDDYNSLYGYIRKINGTYTKYINDPKFEFDEGQQQLWEKIRNTAFTKQGDSKPSIGFYEIKEGPNPEIFNNDNASWFNQYYYGYVFFITPDGTRRCYLQKGGKDGVYINTNDVSFKINTTNGNNITISNITLPYEYGMNGSRTKSKFSFDDSFMEYTETQLGSLFNGSYTSTPYDYATAANNERGSLWNQIRNTAWKKNGESTPSIGFYVNGNGPVTDSVQDYPGYTANDGYVYFMTPDGINSSRLVIDKDLNVGYSYSLSISINGNTIKAGNEPGSNLLSFKITVSDNGNTITISSIQLPYDNEYDIANKRKSKFCFYNGVQYNNMATEYTESQLSAYFNGTYTKASSDPNYTFDEKRAQLWAQVKNTAWKRQGDSKPSIGFYEWDKGPSPDIYYNDNHTYGYIYLLTKDGSKYLEFNNYVSKVGNSMTIGGSICKIDMSNNTITISNMSNQNDWNYGASFSDDITGARISYSSEQLGALFNGAYSKTPDYDWDEDIKALWNQLKNTAWTKQGDSKPTLGYYEKDKGPSLYYSSDQKYDGYIYFNKQDRTQYSSIGLTIYNYPRSISINGGKMAINTGSSFNSIMYDFAISNNGTTLNISNTRKIYEDDSSLSGYWYYENLNGTYTKASSDPDFDWNN